MLAGQVICVCGKNVIWSFKEATQIILINSTFHLANYPDRVHFFNSLPKNSQDILMRLRQP